MAVSQSFVDFVLGQLESIGPMNEPVDVLEDGDALLQWATRSIAIAGAQRTAKAVRHK